MHHYCIFLYTILIFFFSPLAFFSLSLTFSLQHVISTTDQRNLALPTTQRPTTANHHHHNITIHNNLTTKSTKNQTHPHTDTPTETERALLRTCVCGLLLGSQWERASVLVEEIRVFGLTRMNLCACGLVIGIEKDTCGGIEKDNTCGGIEKDTCGGIRVWVEGEMSDCEVERERWLQSRRGEGEASFHPWRWQCLQEWRESF